MPQSIFKISLVSGVVLCLLVPFIGLAGHALPQGDGPFLVLSLPFATTASAVIRDAGGVAVGPMSTAIAAVSSNASAEDLIRAGAFSVQSVAALPFFCSTESSQ